MVIKASRMKCGWPQAEVGREIMARRVLEEKLSHPQMRIF